MLLKLIKTAIFSFILVFCLNSSVMAALDTIWSEDFSNYVQGTTVGLDYNTANSAIDWTTRPIDNDAKWFEVRNSHFIVFGGRDTDDPVFWESELIDISSWDDVYVSLDVGETGNQDSGEYINVQYIVDGVIDYDYKFTGDFTSDVASKNISGNDLRIIIEIDNDHQDEFHYFDNILVQGSPVPVPTSILLFGSGIVGLIGFRRKTRQ